jgi:hypothetical protein
VSALSAVRARQSPTLPGSVCEPIEDHPNEKRKRSQCSCLVVARPTLHPEDKAMEQAGTWQEYGGRGRWCLVHCAASDAHS